MKFNSVLMSGLMAAVMATASLSFATEQSNPTVIKHLLQLAATNPVLDLSEFDDVTPVQFGKDAQSIIAKLLAEQKPVVSAECIVASKPVGSKSWTETCHVSFEIQKDQVDGDGASLGMSFDVFVTTNPKSGKIERRAKPVIQVRLAG